MENTLIEFKNVQKTFGVKNAVKNLSFSVNNGEFFVLVGASGSGKTTTLRMINELIRPTDGDIYFNNKRIKDYNERALRLQMGYVLQQIALFPNMTVAQNVMLIPSLKKFDKRDFPKLINRLLSDVDLDAQSYRDRMPNELSGGEQQRIGILRAFAAQPKIVLMDEPFSALDPISRTQLQNLVLDIHHKLQSTIVFVTHDMDEALKLGDRIGVMREGKLLQVGTPKEVVQHPVNDFVQKLFENSMSHDVYDVLLRKLNVLGYMKSVENSVGKTKLSQDDTIRDALSVLTEQSKVSVNIDDSRYVELTRDNLFRFISDYRNH
ncbi:MAG TPA: ABC transporter ATP-binding protein [Lactobacillus sp.]|nr:ABC transporter ATP-binding protein [Lactobacillus sp.]